VFYHLLFLAIEYRETAIFPAPGIFKEIILRHNGINRQLVKRESSIQWGGNTATAATAHRQLISLRLFGTGTGHVS
jgi:hypothetical protein